MIPNRLYTPEIKQIIGDLVYEGATCYEDVSESDRERLTVGCMNAFGSEAYIFISDSEKLDLAAIRLKKFLASGKGDDFMDIAFAICEGAVKMIDSWMPELFDEIYNENQNEKCREAGLRSITDEQTGEARWVR